MAQDPHRAVLDLLFGSQHLQRLPAVDGASLPWSPRSPSPAGCPPGWLGSCSPWPGLGGLWEAAGSSVRFPLSPPHPGLIWGHLDMAFLPSCCHIVPEEPKLKRTEAVFRPPQCPEVAPSLYFDIRILQRCEAGCWSQFQAAAGATHGSSTSAPVARSGRRTGVRCLVETSTCAEAKGAARAVMAHSP